jgi:hypothetical protein
MEKMVMISSDSKLQQYLKKIIMSANQIIKKYFIEEINQVFDPDRVY